MAISLVAVGQKITAALMNQVIGQVNGIALIGIKPTSVAGTGVTVSNNGSVTFTNATTVSLNGVFTGTYDNYRIVWNSSTRSSNNTMYFRLRQAGTDISTTTYAFNKGYDTGTARVVQQNTAQNMAALDIAAGIGQTSDGYTDIFGPANGGYTTGTGLCFVWVGGVPYTITTGFYNSTATGSDGISFFPSAGTWSGTIRVYGYNNLT